MPPPKFRGMGLQGTFWGLETARLGWGSSMRRVGGQKVRSLPRASFFPPVVGTQTLSSGLLPKGGGGTGGAAKPHEEDPARKRVSDPPHLGTFCPAPPFLLLSPLEVPRISPTGDHLRNHFRRVTPKIPSNRPSSRGFAFRYVLTPPLALKSWWGGSLVFVCPKRSVLIFGHQSLADSPNAF